MCREFLVGVERRELGELADHVLRGVEQETRVGLGEHGRVVVGVAGRDHAPALMLYLQRQQVELTDAPENYEALIREGIARQPGAPYLLVQTVLVQEQALKAAQERVGADRIQAGHRLIGLEEKGERIVAKFENGASAEGDLLIGADGIHSAVRKFFYPNQTPHYSGTCMWRSTSLGKPFRTGATMAVIGHHMQKFTT